MLSASRLSLCAAAARRAWAVPGTRRRSLMIAPTGLLGRRSRRGVAAAEFAVIGSLLAVIMIGVTDLMLFMRGQVKLESAAVQVGQVVSQCSAFTNGDYAGDTGDFWRLADSALGGIATVSSSSATSVIVSGVVSVNNANRVAWQVRSKADVVSHVGTAGNAATITSGFIVPTGQVLVVTEVNSPVQGFLRTSLLADIGAVPTDLTSTTFFLGRVGDGSSLAQPPQNSSTKVCMA